MRSSNTNRQFNQRILFSKKKTKKINAENLQYRNIHRGKKYLFLQWILSQSPATFHIFASKTHAKKKQQQQHRRKTWGQSKKTSEINFSKSITKCVFNIKNYNVYANKIFIFYFSAIQFKSINLRIGLK